MIPFKGCIIVTQNRNVFIYFPTNTISNFEMQWACLYLSLHTCEVFLEEKVLEVELPLGQSINFKRLHLFFTPTWSTRYVSYWILEHCGNIPINQAERPRLSGWTDIKNDIIFSPRESLMRICSWRQQTCSLKACVWVCVCGCVSAHVCVLLHDFLWVPATTPSMHRLSFQGPCLCFLIVS